MSMAFKVLLICLGSIKMEFSIKGGEGVETTFQLFIFFSGYTSAEGDVS